MKRNILILSSLVLLLSMFIGGQTVFADEETYYCLPVFETSDTHGYLADASGNDPQYLLAYISDKVWDVRGYGADSRKDLAVLLDGGDIYQGNTMSNLMNGAPISAAYMIMGYDAVTIGNHEFDWGIENTVDPDRTMMDYTIGGKSGENSIPVVVSNLYQNGERIPFAHEYIILNKTAADKAGNEISVRVGVIGFAGNYGSSIMYERFTGQGYTVSPDYDRVNAIAAELESSGMCDATILLAHDDASAVAAAVGEDTVIDLVLGGHTHQNTIGENKKGLCYIQPASQGSAYAYCELVFGMQDGAPVFERVSDAKTVPVTEDTSRLTNTQENADDLDHAIVAVTDEVIEALSDILKTEIGYITTSAERYVYLPESGERSTTCGNWMTSIMSRIVDADVCFVNNGGIRTDFVVRKKEGKRGITLSDIYTMFPFNNKIYCYEITYDEFLTALQYSLTDRGMTLLSQMTGIDCYYSDETVHAIVTYDGQTVYANGKWTEGWKDKTLRVAISDYIATTDRVSAGGMSNPFCAWNSTARLISSDIVDNEGAFAVLSREAAGSGGALYIDTEPHYINRAYEEPASAQTPDPTKAPSSAKTPAASDSSKSDGKADASYNAESPKTADENPIVLWAVVMMVPAGLLAALLIVRRKKSRL